MNRYLKILKAELEIAAKRYFENRVSTLGTIGANLLSLFLMIVFVEVYFSFTKEIFGWSKFQVIFLTGIYRTANSVFNFLFMRSISFIPNYVKTGELDLFLTKPVNTQFFLSFRFTRIFELISIFSGLVVVFYALINLNMELSLLSWFELILGLIIGLAIFYGLYYSLSTISIWLGRFDSLSDVYNLLNDPLRYPTDILGKRLSLLLTFIIPLGFVVTIPVKVFFGSESSWMLLIGGIFAVLIVWFSFWFWKLSLRHYTSASS